MLTNLIGRGLQGLLVLLMLILTQKSGFVYQHFLLQASCCTEAKPLMASSSSYCQRLASQR